MKKIMMLVLMLALSVPVFADHPEGPPPGKGNGHQTPAEIAAAEVKFLTALLDLSLAQQSSALGWFTTAETTKATLEADLQAQEEAIVTAILANNVSGYTTAATKIGNDAAGIAFADAQAQALFNHSLSADQQKKYASFISGEFELPEHGGAPAPGHAPPGHGHGHGHHE
jgi:hypothetical protein